MKPGYLPRIFALTVMAILLAGCSAKRAAQVSVPAAPPISTSPVPADSNSEENSSRKPSPATPSAPANAHPLFTQTGLASWYGPDYDKHRGSNGEIYDMHQLTAAHLTLPLNSVVRVTNLTTRESVMVRITDRGPFVADRIIDLSMEAARRISVYHPGIAKVKLEVLQAPANLNTGGRWEVQIGGFGDEDTATQVKDKLERRYRTAKVLDFKGPRRDWWVRVRVLHDDKQRAQQIARENTTPEGGIYLVRID